MIRAAARRASVVAAVVVVVLVGTVGVAAAWEKGNPLPRQYAAILESADTLWTEYKQADAKYFEQDKTDTASHAKKLAALQDKLAAVHATWMQTAAPAGLEVVDMKVGLALELQMAAIGAELVGLLGEDESYLELSSELDSEYETVVNDL